MSYWHEAIAKLNREQVAMFTLKSQRISRAAPQNHYNAGCKDTTVKCCKNLPFGYVGRSTQIMFS